MISLYLCKLSHTHTHSNSHKHSCILVHAERHVQTSLSLPLRYILYFKAVVAQTSFETTQFFIQLCRNRPMNNLVLAIVFFSLAITMTGILCIVWGFLFMYVPPTYSGDECFAPATKKSLFFFLVLFFANSFGSTVT